MRTWEKAAQCERPVNQVGPEWEVSVGCVGPGHGRFGLKRIGKSVKLFKQRSICVNAVWFFFHSCISGDMRMGRSWRQERSPESDTFMGRALLGSTLGEGQLWLL